MEVKRTRFVYLTSLYTKTPAVSKFFELIFRNNFLERHISKNLSDENYSGTSPPTSSLLQTVPTSKILQVPLCLDVLFEHFKQSANKPSPFDVSQKNTLHCPNSITKAMDGLFKHEGNRA